MGVRLKMAKSNQKLDKNGKPVTGYAAFVAQEWSEINKTRTEKVTQTKFIAISKSLGRKWRKMSKAAKNNFSNPESAESKEKVHKQEVEENVDSAPSDKNVTNEKLTNEKLTNEKLTNEKLTSEKEKIINQLNELTNKRQKIADEKEKLTNQIKKIEIEKKKVAYERAQLEYEKEELTNQLREFAAIESEDELSPNDPGSESTIVSLKPNLHAWSDEEYVEDFDEISVE